MSTNKTEEKGLWDKVEILGKISLPVVIGAATFWVDSQISERENSSDMIKLAVGILSEEADINESQALRDWAVQILTDKGGLSLDAANELRTKGLSFLGGSVRYSIDEEADTADFSIRFGNSD